MSHIPYGRQSISAEDIAAVAEVLCSDWLTQGPMVAAFEQAVAEYCQAKYAVAVMNATAALHIACLALGVGEGDIVWTSPNTFLASANCARYCGAKVDFVDICSKTYNLSPRKLKKKLEQAKLEGVLPKVLIPVHFAGQACEMREIKALADEYGFKIIEDASHAIGGSYLGERVGNCRYSDIAVFSFHPVKILTTAEGGMALTNDQALAEKMYLLRSHGMTRNPDLMTNASEGAWYYQMQELGFNYRITDLQCALGLSQLKRLDEFVQERRRLVARYNEKLATLPLVLPFQHPDTYSAFHLYVVQVDPKKTSKTRLEIFNALRSADIGVNVHYIPVHLQPYYQQFGFKEGDYPKAESYYHHAISLPLYPKLTNEQQDYVISVLQKAFDA